MGSPGLGRMVGYKPLRRAGPSGHRQLPFSAGQPPSPWPRVTTRGGACVSVYERVEVARVPTCLGRWSAAWPRQGWPPEAAPAARPGLGPPVPGWWAGHWLSTDFDLCSPRARLPFLVSLLPLGGFIWRRLFSRLVLHKGSVLCTSGAPSPWPSLLVFSFPCSSPGIYLDPCPLQPGMILGWLFLISQAGCGLPPHSRQRGACGISK